MAQWHHAPPHCFDESGVYFITGATHLKQHILRSPEKLELFSSILFGYLESADLELDAWAFFSNHYHLM